MFANAKIVKPVTGKKKSEKVEVEFQNLEAVAAIETMMKSLKALKETLEADVKSQMQIEFVKAGCDKRARPANFLGVEGVAEASCELRARASTSPLSPSEITLLTDAKLPVETVDTVLDTYIINPAYKDDQDLLAKAGAALQGVDGIPDDFILKQEGSSKTIVGKDALDALFKIEDVKTVEKLLPVIGVFAIKPVLKVGEGESAVEIANRIVAALLTEEEDSD